MKATLVVPFNECCVELYLTLQDITKLKSLKLCMEKRIGNDSYLDSNTIYCLTTTILNALGKNNENN